MIKLFLLSAALAAAATPATAQTVSGTPAVVSDKARITELEAQLRRQTLIAENARKEVEIVRANARLKDELILLARQRNAELYAIATEILDRGMHPRSVEPFLQTRRVKMENLKQAFEDRLNAARIFETTQPPSVQLRMDSELKAKRAADAAAPRN
ncbi:hypothetical protein [Sphingomonas hengshuiensis]|uniref:Uncharacterized protein n=1 Tax=Sphingomonas hengshuiensis TaxID=1609977 RepID=A0A7U4J6I2_9SPHN|nr:hypothetical protein [Sphingomonas hengshuiensis]AJP71147.1 hypothetical protein TS85_03895 [Sphingomonas hengshuiensis]